MRRVRNPRVIVVLLALLTATSITVCFFAGDVVFFFTGEDTDNRVALYVTRTVAVLVGIVALWPLISKGYEYPWTGFGQASLPKENEKEEIRRSKTLWDWLELLIVPAVLALGGVWFAAQQDVRQQAIEEQRAYDAALQAYLDQMSTLVLANNLRSSTEDNATEDSKDARALARARTLAVLGSLGPDLGQGPNRKRTVMEFLYEASLIDKDNLIIRLDTANLENADLDYLNLENAYLPLVYLNGANLDHADLEDADLGGADLSGAYLADANLSNASLSSAILNDANLSRADLDSTYLSDAKLYGANLADANLSGAFLRGAKGVSEKTLAQQTDDLGLATMPDGTVHAGRYVTDEFVESDESGSTLSFNVGKGWERNVNNPASTGELYLKGPEGGLLIFTSPLHVFEPTNPSELKEASAPENANEWVSWFEKHPNLDTKIVTKKPGPVNVGNAQVNPIVVTYASKPEKYPREFCYGRDCVPLFPTSVVPGGLVSFDGEKDWFVIVDVDGKPVVIDISAPEGKFDTFLPEAQKVLDTVEWENNGP